MRYFDGIGNRMHADIAFRLGYVLNDYISKVHKDDFKNFSSTLALSVLETVLCNFVEKSEDKDSGFRVIKKNFKNEYKVDLDFVIDDFCPNVLDLKKTNILNSSFSSTTCFNFLKNIRNALSHPFNYSSKNMDSLKKCLSNKETMLKTGIYTNFDNEIYKQNFVITDYYFVTEGISKKSNKFYYSIYKLSSSELINLTLKLCEIMSQPVIHDWKDFDKSNYINIFENIA
jgi:hypothetical protein